MSSTSSSPRARLSPALILATLVVVLVVLVVPVAQATQGRPVIAGASNSASAVTTIDNSSTVSRYGLSVTLPNTLDTKSAAIFAKSRYNGIWGQASGSNELHAWRWRDWYPALDAAGVERRVPYAMRHTFASLAIAAGVSLFELSRFMGTSPQMLDATYGHLLPDALERGRFALDTFIDEAEERREEVQNA